jgi:hypothetical protein
MLHSGGIRRPCRAADKPLRTQVAKAKKVAKKEAKLAKKAAKVAAKF